MSEGRHEPEAIGSLQVAHATSAPGARACGCSAAQRARRPTATRRRACAPCPLQPAAPDPYTFPPLRRARAHRHP